MKPVAANLEPLLICPAFWLWHVLGAIVCIPAMLYAWSSGELDEGAWIAVFIVPAWSAWILTSLQRDLLVSPVSFCLPGHRDVLRLTLLLVGVAASLAAALPLLNYPGLGGLSLLWAIWSAFCFGLIVYVATVSFLFLVDHFMIALLPGVIVGGVLIEFPTARFLAQEVALFMPGWNTLALAALGMLTWKRLGNVSLARRTCGSRFLSHQMAWSRSANEEFGARKQREFISKGTWAVRSWFLRKCLARISRHPALSYRRYLAATRYELAGHQMPVHAGSVALIVLAALILMVAVGYAPLREGRPETPDATEANIVYMASCVLGMYMPIPMFSTMLLPAGRRERFFTAVTIALGGGLVVLATSLLFYVLILGIGKLAPPFTIGGVDRIFRPAELSPAFVPLVVLPMAFLVKLLCKWTLVPEILLLLGAGAFIVKGNAVLRDVSPFAIIVIVTASWAILVGVLYAYSFHRDLVRE